MANEIFGKNTSLSINGQEVAKCVKLEVKYEIPPIPDDFLPISPLMAHAMAEMKMKIETKILQAMGVPQSIFAPPPRPAWVDQVIRIPQRRIDEILGR